MTANIELVNENTNISIKKKKGRPRKNPIEVNTNSVNVEQEKKKRGRKKKEKVEEEVKQKKKRGRKAALKFFSSTIRKKIPLTTVIYDNEKSILHLDIKDDDDDEIKKSITYDVLKTEYNKDDILLGSKISYLETGKRTFDSEEDDINTNNNSDEDEDDILCEFLENKEDIDITELYEKRLQNRLKQDDQLIKNLENLHNDDNLLSKVLNNVDKKVKETKISINNNDIDFKKTGILTVLSNYIDVNEWIDKTDVCCWWCCHKFNTIPIGLPIDYNSKLKKFRVTGIFCSFACMLAYDTRKDMKSKSMITHLYKKLTGGYSVDLKDDCIKMLYDDNKIKELFKDNDDYRDEYIKSVASFIDEPLVKAPPRCTLKIFGGDLNIDEFRKASKERKIYKMVEYPMYISRDYVEEVDLHNIKKINKNLFSKQTYIQQPNTLDNKKLEEVKNRVNSSVVVTNNSIDRFITF